MVAINTLSIFLTLANAAIFGADDRLTLAQMAQKSGLSVSTFRSKVAATGRMHCSDWGIVGTAHITGKSDVVTTSAHNFFIQGRCSQLRKTTDCWVEFPLQSRDRYLIKSNSLELGGCARDNGADVDWAVFEINKPVSGVTPYSLPKDTFLYPAGSDVMATVAFADNFNIESRQNTGRYSFQICKIRDRYILMNIGIQHDCDSGGGSSGGALLVHDGDKTTIVGLMHGFLSDLQPGSQYDSHRNFGIGTALAGRFLESLRQRTGQAQNPQR